MTTLAEIQDLAADLHDQRPDWDLVPIMNHLLPYRTMAYDELVALATAWAQDGKNRTPASLQWMRGSSPKPDESDSSKRKKEPRCYICGNYQSDCERLREWETKNGVPDPHDFETKEQADANRSSRQWAELSKELQEQQRAARARVRAALASAEIRPTRFGDTLAALTRPNETVRKCLGCGGTLAQTQTDHHPGCVPVDA
jgi:hypothetical protein